MSFVMIAAGSTHGARMRTLSLRRLLLLAAVAACSLLFAGAGLGYWMSRPEATAGTAAQPLPSASLSATHPATHPASPFAIEQLGALSGRLFKLESQAGRLSERLGTSKGPATQLAPVTGATKSDRGGPMLPPRAEPNAHDELGLLEARMAGLEAQIASASDAATLQNLALLRLPTRVPIEGAELVSSFGNRDDPLTGRRAFHGGLDFAASVGTAIHAAAGGKVTVAGFKADFGWVVEVDHGNGLGTRYAHASLLYVKVGDLVTPGDRIAAVGSSGRSTGPHLHFEVLRRGEAIDPRRYLAGL